MSKRQDIQAIIEGCKNGQPKFQRALVELYSDRLYATCIRYLKDRHAAKDALQETLIRVFKYIDGFNPGKGNIFNWMTTIAIRQCLQSLDKRKLEVIPIENHYGREGTIDAEVLDKIGTDDLIDLVNELPEGYRTVFHLSVIDGYSHREIGEMLGLREGASRSRLSRAKELLRKKISVIESQQQWTNIS